MPPPAAPRALGLLLTEGFSLMSYASIVEPFRAANDLAGRELYRWRHIAVEGDSITASNGATLLAHAEVKDAPALDALFVFAAGDPARFRHAPTFAWLRRLARADVQLGGVSGGPFLLARAGVLAGYRCTIHWDHAPALREAFPDLLLEDALYVIDRRRMSCAGGVAGLDLALDLIAREQGAGLARAVGDWFIRTQPRLAREAQRAGAGADVRDARVARALAAMEARLEQKVSRAELAEGAGLSVRQLERLFARELGEGVEAAYRRLRLTQAEHLLRATARPVLEVGLACGFSGPSQFSRAFKQAYGAPPAAWRADLTARRGT